MSSASITVCVPVGPNHVHLIPRLLKILAASERRPDQVLIAPSAPMPATRVTESGGLSVRTLKVEEGATASANRNRGWDESDTAYVTFRDVDDWYAPWRISMLLDGMYAHSAHVAYHSYRYLAPPWLVRRPKGAVRAAGPEVLASLNLGIASSLERTAQGGNNPRFPRVSGSSKAHLGHVTVSRDLDIRFHGIAHGEDGWFAVEALRRRLRLVYLAAPLSIYDPLSARNLRLAAESRARHSLKQLGSRHLRRNASA